MTNEEAIEILKNEFSECRDTISVYAEKRKKAFDMAINALEQKPKIGYWIEEDVFDGELVYRCSECGEPFWLESGTPKDNEYNFCPKCGAKMAESEDKE